MNPLGTHDSSRGLSGGGGAIELVQFVEAVLANINELDLRRLVRCSRNAERMEFRRMLLEHSPKSQFIIRISN